MPAAPKPKARKLRPLMSTAFRPILSARRPAMKLVSAAMIIITENRLPAATVESEKVWLISGSAMPKVATIIDGIRLEQGTMQSVKRCIVRRAPRLGFSMDSPYLRGIMMQSRGWPPITLVMWPWPVVSSASMTSPGPKRLTVPSPISISTCPARVITYWRRGAG